MEPLISVIIPTYNRLTQLQEALLSVKAQDYKNFEIIVVDDGSTDGTAAWLGEQQVSSLIIRHTGFPGLVRNKGARLAKGEYLCFLDSDDVWKEQKLTRQVDFFRHHPQIVVCHTREIWKRNGKIISQVSQDHARQGNIFPDALKKCIIGPSTVMILPSVFFNLGAFREDLEIAEDYELWLRLTARFEIGYIEEPLVEKRAGHGGELSGKYGHIELFRIWALLINISEGTFTASQLALACGELVRKCRIYALGCEKRCRYDESCFYRELANQVQSRITLPGIKA
jgi:glycosyltransferase involved in cell wall biosynthesis